MPSLRPLQVAGTNRSSLNPQIGRSSFGVERGQIEASAAVEKVGNAMQNLANERLTNQGIQAGIQAQEQASKALFHAYQNDPVNYADNAKKILEETKLSSTKKFNSTFEEKAFNAKWNSFAASKMVNAYQATETAVKQQTVATYQNSIDNERQNIIRNAGDPTESLAAANRLLEDTAKRMDANGIKKDNPLYVQGMDAARDQIKASKVAGLTQLGKIEDAKAELGKKKSSTLDPDVYNKLAGNIKAKEFAAEVSEFSNKAASYVGAGSDELFYSHLDAMMDRKDLSSQEKNEMRSQATAAHNIAAQQLQAAYASEVQKLADDYIKTGDASKLASLGPETRQAVMKIYENATKTLTKPIDSINLDKDYANARHYVTEIDFTSGQNMAGDQYVALLSKYKNLRPEDRKKLDKLFEEGLTGKMSNKSRTVGAKLYARLVGPPPDAKASEKERTAFNVWQSQADSSNWGAIPYEQAEKEALARVKSDIDVEGNFFGGNESLFELVSKGKRIDWDNYDEGEEVNLGGFENNIVKGWTKEQYVELRRRFNVVNSNKTIDNALRTASLMAEQGGYSSYFIKNYIKRAYGINLGE